MHIHATALFMIGGFILGYRHFFLSVIWGWKTGDYINHMRNGYGKIPAGIIQ